MQLKMVLLKGAEAVKEGVKEAATKAVEEVKK
jgi:hypothetical protein